jgi:HEAT repeat protein
MATRKSRDRELDVERDDDMDSRDDGAAGRGKRVKSAKKGGFPVKLAVILGGAGCVVLGGILVIGAVLVVIFGFSKAAPVLEFAGPWPEPGFHGNGLDTVTFHVAGCEDKYTREEVQFKINKLADPGAFMRSSAAHQGDRMTVHLTPVADANACAKRVDFGTVHSVSLGVISVKATKVAGPDGADPVSIALYYLKSLDKGKRNEAMRNLKSMAPNERAADVTKALQGMLTDPDLFARADAVEAYGVWASGENAPALRAALQDKEWIVRERAIGALARIKDVPALLPLVQDKEMMVRHKAIAVLAQLKDVRAIEPIADRLGEFSDRGPAGKALTDFGPAAEKALIARLNHANNDVRVESCHILAKIGTAQSLPALQQLTNDKNFFLKLAAQDAVKALQKQK